MTPCPVCGHHPSPRTATRQAHALAAHILTTLPVDSDAVEHREAIR